jgi:hypothetical protein
MGSCVNTAQVSANGTDIKVFVCIYFPHLAPPLTGTQEGCLL